jgi:hypothetical protein
MRIYLVLVLSLFFPSLFGGIADRYPNDVGIGNDPAVILFDGFENYDSAAGLKSRWNQVFQSANLRISTEAGNYVGGHKGLEMKLPVSSSEVTNKIAKIISPQEPTLFIRAYAKFDLGFNVVGSSHNGIAMRSANYPGPGHPAPRDGTGFFGFGLQHHKIGTGRGGEVQPGYGHIYAYWPFQRERYGDHWYPDGWVKPGGWGLWILYPFQYPDFEPLPNWQPVRGLWYCYELMVKVNTLGQRDGVVAYWIDGQLAGRFPNLFIRSIDSLKVNYAALNLHASSSSRINKKWYDNVVIARKYIGPISQ